MHFKINTLLIDIFLERNLPGEPLAWIDRTTPGNPWTKVLGVVLVLDWRKRLPPAPIVIGGVAYPPHPKALGPLV